MQIPQIVVQDIEVRIDLSLYEKLYDSFDLGHDRRHMQEVRESAILLAKKYCPEQMELVYVSATLHDIGLQISREDHEKHGYEIIVSDKVILEAYDREEIELIGESVREHRASTGNPKSTIAKIVSDADKIGHSTSRVLNRAYSWERNLFPDLDKDKQLLSAAYHLKGKFGDKGPGARLYFKESEQRLKAIFEPIFKALENSDLIGLNKILEEERDV